MARAVDEWIGKTDDARAPQRVRARIFDREEGRCHICRQPIIGKKWALDHVVALINGGENRESNLKPVHIACHAEKSAADLAEKARIASKRAAHIGAKPPPKQKIKSRGFPKAKNRVPKPSLPPRQLYMEK